MMAVNLKKTHSALCGTPEAIEETYKHVSCIQESNLESFLRIMDKLVGLTDHTLSVPRSEMIPTMCCGVRLLLERTEKQVNALCKNITGVNSGTRLMQVASSTLGDFLDLMCAKYSSVGECYATENELTARLDKMQRSQPVTHRRMMRSILKVLQRFESDMLAD